MTKQDLPDDSSSIKPGDILARKIDTYAPMRDGQKFIAIIRGFPMYFTGDTAMKAMKIADDFRLAQALKVRRRKFPEHLREKAEAATKRMNERREARRAKK